MLMSCYDPYDNRPSLIWSVWFSYIEWYYYKQISKVILISNIILKSLYNTMKKWRKKVSGVREGKVLLVLVLLRCLQNFEKEIKGIKAASENNHVVLLKSKGFLELHLRNLQQSTEFVNTCVSREKSTAVCIN